MLEVVIFRPDWRGPIYRCGVDSNNHPKKAIARGMQRRILSFPFFLFCVVVERAGYYSISCLHFLLLLPLSLLYFPLSFFLPSPMGTPSNKLGTDRSRIGWGWVRIRLGWGWSGQVGLGHFPLSLSLSLLRQE